MKRKCGEEREGWSTQAMSPKDSPDSPSHPSLTEDNDSFNRINYPNLVFHSKNIDQNTMTKHYEGIICSEKEKFTIENNPNEDGEGEETDDSEDEEEMYSEDVWEENGEGGIDGERGNEMGEGQRVRLVGEGEVQRGRMGIMSTSDEGNESKQGESSSIRHKIQEKYGFRLPTEIEEIVNTCKEYKRVGSTFIFVNENYHKGVHLQHIKKKSIHLNADEIQTIIFKAARVITMYSEGNYQRYDGSVFNISLETAFKGLEIYMGLDVVFFNNIVSIEMPMREFHRLYKYLLKHREMFEGEGEGVGNSLPCAFTHANRANYLDCRKCGRY